MKRIPDASATSIESFIRANIITGSVIHTNDRRCYKGISALGYSHEIAANNQTRQQAHETMPYVYQVSSLLKRWLLGTYQGGISPQHLDYYLDEFTFRFNFRHSRGGRVLFYHLVRQAVSNEVVPYKALVGGTKHSQPQNVEQVSKKNSSLFYSMARLTAAFHEISNSMQQKLLPWEQRITAAFPSPMRTLSGSPTDRELCLVSDPLKKLRYSTLAIQAAVSKSIKMAGLQPEPKALADHWLINALLKTTDINSFKLNPFKKPFLEPSSTVNEWLVQLCLDGNEALSSDPDSVERFLHYGLWLSNSQIAGILRGVLGKNKQVDHQDIRSIAAAALWEVLRDLKPELVEFEEGTPILMIEHWWTPLWIDPLEDKAIAYLTTAFKREAKRLVMAYGTSNQLGVFDRDKIEIEHRAAARLERGKTWQRSERVELTEDIDSLEWSPAAESSKLLLNSMAVTKNDRERQALLLIAKTGNQTYSYKTAGLTRGEYRSLQDRLKRNIKIS